MTREKILDMLRMIEFKDTEAHLHTWYKGIDDDMNEAVRMAIETLEAESREDAISRQAVLDLIEHYNSSGLGAVFYGYEEGVKFADAVNKLPPQLKTGHWTYVFNSTVNGLKVCECDACKKRAYGSTHFCPNCGAKMEVE